jgi:hypothetical protein
MRNTRAFVFVCAGLLGLALLLPRPAAATWPTDPAVNVPLCIASGDQDQPTSVSDGASGAIVTWVDYRGGNGDIYAQRISPMGNVLWTANGVALCAATGDQYSPAIVADGAGGAIVVWADGRSGAYDLYAQRISASGAVQWTANGVALCTAAASQWSPAMVADGAGGAIVSWIDGRSGTSDDLYAQRISASGVAQWTADGVALCSATGAQGSISIAPDGASGAIVVWDDYRSASNYDIYAQRILAAGTVQWTANGVALCTATGGQYSPAIVSDDASGAIVTWYDQRSGTYDIYAQRILAAGTVNWTANGVALCAATGEQYYPVAVADRAGGAIVTWFDRRSGGYDIYAQRVSSAGAVQWTANGVALCTAAGTQWYPVIVTDASGGAIVTWSDSRGATYDLYAQRISIGGAVQWTANGVALCTATGLQELGTVIADGAGGAVAAWVDGRNATFDVYAQHVLASGQLGGTVDVPGEAALTLAFALEPVRPNPSRGGALTVRFTLAGPAAASLELLDVAGRCIAARDVGSLGAGSHALDLGQGQHLAPGLYLVRLTQGANTRVTRVAVLR